MHMNTKIFLLSEICSTFCTHVLHQSWVSTSLCPRLRQAENKKEKIPNSALQTHCLYQDIKIIDADFKSIGI